MNGHKQTLHRRARKLSVGFLLLAGCMSLSPQAASKFAVPESATPSLGDAAPSASAIEPPSGATTSLSPIAPRRPLPLAAPDVKPPEKEPFAEPLAGPNLELNTEREMQPALAPPGEPTTIARIPTIERDDGAIFSKGLDLVVAAPARVQVGSHATFRLSLGNQGEEPLDDVSVLCEFDPSLVFIGSQEKQVLQRVGRIAGRETKELALSLTSVQTGLQGCRFTVKVRDNEQDVVAIRKSADVTFVPRQFQLGLVGPVQRTVGSRAEFNVQLSNRSNVDLADCLVTLTYDAALFPKEATEGAVQKPRTLVWTLSKLKARESVQLQVEFECRTPAHRACLQVETGGRDFPSEQAEACIEIVPVPGVLDLRVSDAQDPLDIGKQGTYEVRVQNIGLQVVRKVQLEVEVPPQLKFLSAKVEQDGEPLKLTYKQEGQKLIFDPIDQFAPDSKLLYVIEAEGQRTGMAEFRATLSSALSRVAYTAAEPTTITEP